MLKTLGRPTSKATNRFAGQRLRPACHAPPLRGGDSGWRHGVASGAMWGCPFWSCYTFRGWFKMKLTGKPPMLLGGGSPKKDNSVHPNSKHDVLLNFATLDLTPKYLGSKTGRGCLSIVSRLSFQHEKWVPMQHRNVGYRWRSHEGLLEASHNVATPTGLIRPLVLLWTVFKDRQPFNNSPYP